MMEIERSRAPYKHPLELVNACHFLSEYTEMRSEMGCVTDLTRYGIEPNPGPGFSKAVADDN